MARTVVTACHAHSLTVDNTIDLPATHSMQTHNRWRSAAVVEVRTVQPYCGFSLKTLFKKHNLRQ